MHTEHYRNTQPCGGSGSGGGPAFLYGYCHDSGRMRMMNMPDYMRNMQTGYTNMAQAPATLMQQMAGVVSSPSSNQSYEDYQGHGGHERQHGHQKHGCGCQEREDCGCECCIRCADTVEYVRCGETRKIPITFDNDSRRERLITLELGSVLTDGGRKLDWPASLSQTEFTLGPCGEKTVLLTITVNCGQRATTPVTGGNVDVNANPNQDAPPVSIESCLVGYLTVRADGCMIRPIIVAIAALPDRCGAHHIGCLCGCCC
ncbi:MAG: hypothetical protein ABI076_09680 [Acidobacteriaceae bacterium]